MASSLSPVLSAPAAQAKLLRIKLFFVGLAQDFWKDTPLTWPSFSLFRKTKEAGAQVQVASAQATDQNRPKENAPSAQWFADRIQILERMWGEGHALPGDDAYIDSLIKPLGMTKEMSVLDLSAGLGGMARRIAEMYGSYVTGMEPDQMLASRGMIMSIAAGRSKQASVVAYDPASFTAQRKYDCVFARELFYRVIGKDTFIKAVGESLKTGGGQLVFTDYLLNPEHREKPAILRWMSSEPDIAPLTLPETLKHWKGLGFDMRIAEDQTDLYKHEILKGFARLAEFLSSAQPDAETKRLLLREIDLWTRRLEAFDHGLKYCRFYGMRY